jgi:hypothetical protein
LGRIVSEPPTPSVMTLNPIEENTRNAAMIFFIDFGERKVQEPGVEHSNVNLLSPENLR